ncbi:MAG: DUF2142 domain-containing protein [Methanobrevibacter sp.]|nr:DUF2142 domain-containing protein [Methanobrevibacter sp.]
MFIIINFPFAVCDENQHFIKAFDISYGHFIPENNHVTVPKSIGDVIKSNGAHYIIIDLKRGIYTPYMLHLNVNETENLTTSAISYMPLPYLGTAFVIKIGEMFNISPLILIYIGRLINLLIYAIIVYFGIKIVPIGKYIFLLIALMPMSLYEAASLSADSLNLALSFFTICLFLKFVFKENKIYRNDIIVISICILCLSLSKQIYALLGLLFFIIPKSKFKNVKFRLIYFICTILPSFILFIFWNYSIKNFNLMYESISQVSSSFNINILDFLIIMIKSTFSYFNYYLTSFVGTFGWLGIGKQCSFPLALVYIYLFFLIIVSILDVRWVGNCSPIHINKFKLTLKQKIINLLILFLESMIIFFMGLRWTIDWGVSPFSEHIWGVQGRYFIPVAPLLFLILQNKKITNYISRYDRKIVYKYLNIFIIIFIGIILAISTYFIYNMGLSTYIEYNY